MIILDIIAWIACALIIAAIIRKSAAEMGNGPVFPSDSPRNGYAPHKRGDDRSKGAGATHFERGTT